MCACCDACALGCAGVAGCREKDHFLYVGAFSFALFLVNFVVIFLMALGVFKVRDGVVASGVHAVRACGC